MSSKPKAGDCLISKWCGPRLVKHVVGSYVLFVDMAPTVRTHNQRWMTVSAWKQWAKTAKPSVLS